MLNCRYGKFNPGDHMGLWVYIGFTLILSAGCIYYIVLGISVLSAVGCLIALNALTLVYLLIIILSYRERFSIENGVITVQKGRKTSKTVIPDEVTVIVSYAEICNGFLSGSPQRNKIHIMKDKYAVTLLQKTVPDFVFERLHGDLMRMRKYKYTTNIIKNWLFEPWRYIYSFVCDEELLNKVLAGRSCLLVIPESLREKVHLSDDIIADGKVEVYIDPKG